MTQAEIIASKFGQIDADLRNLQRAVYTPTVYMYNNTGDDLAAGDVVIIDSANDRTVIFSTGDGAQAPLVTVVQGNYQDRVSFAKRGYGVIDIVCEGPAISPGDCVVASAIARYGRLDNAATVRNLIGFALDSKAVGVTASIRVLI